MMLAQLVRALPSGTLKQVFTRLIVEALRSVYVEELSRPENVPSCFEEQLRHGPKDPEFVQTKGFEALLPFFSLAGARRALVKQCAKEKENAEAQTAACQRKAKKLEREIG